ncbi:MAG: hypothetical protein K2I20_04885, partial [Clostridia bacterium]|nr:hypothetical protein [Clostridia bacterium]
MSKPEEKNVPAKYLYYDYHNGHIAREEAGNNLCASNRFEFYIDGEWINDYNMSLSLSDATMNCCGYTFGDYEELTEEEAMRLIK